MLMHYVDLSKEYVGKYIYIYDNDSTIYICIYTHISTHVRWWWRVRVVYEHEAYLYVGRTREEE